MLCTLRAPPGPHERRQRCRRLYHEPAGSRSPGGLEHLFKTVTRTSIRDLLRRRRMTEAARLLISTHRRISEISYYVGFGDVSNFNHTFRKEFGVSPREFRRLHEK